MKPSLALLAAALLCLPPAVRAGAPETAAPAAAPTPVAEGPVAPGARAGMGESAAPATDGRPSSGHRPRGDSNEAGLLLAGLALMVGIALRRPGP